MDNFLRLCKWVVLGCLLLAIFSVLAFLSTAQNSQDQDQATATLNLTANYTAQAKVQDKGSNCEDQITLTYAGTARYKLLPNGYGTRNEDPDVLTTYPRAGVQTDRTGGFTINVQGGGNCADSTSGEKITWTYGARYNAVPPNEFPGIGVRLRPGIYGVDYGDPTNAITTQGQILPGRSNFGSPGGRALGKGRNPLDTQQPPPLGPAPASIPYQAGGPARGVLIYLMQQSLQKVSAALQGTFKPYSKQFSASNSVSNNVELPPTNAGQTGTGTLSISYTLTVGNPEEVEAVIIPPDDYEDWIPQGPQEGESPPGPAPPVEPPPIAAATFGGGVMLASMANLFSPLPPTGGLGQGAGPAVVTAVEDLVGNKLEGVKVVLQKKGPKGGKTAQGAQFTVELVGTSQEPGVCLNWPPPEQLKKPTPFDLEIDVKNNPIFDPSQSANTYPQTAVTRPNNLHELKFSILSHDWGAYGTLKVSVQLQDGSPPFYAHLQGKPNVIEMPIPLDDNGNHIARAWTKKNVLYGSTEPDADDVDLPVGDGHEGDGLSLYEKYRGFMRRGAHTSASAIYKNLFVNDLDYLFPGDFGASQLTVWLVHTNEYTEVQVNDPLHENPRVINFDHGFAHLTDVHVLLLVDGPTENGRLGDAIGGPGTPKKIVRVVVDRAACLASHWGEQEVANNVAHELGHSCNVWHHGGSIEAQRLGLMGPGRGNYPTGDVWRRGNDGKWYPLGTGDWWVAAPRMQNSGTENCVMRYYRAYCYQYSQGQFRWHDPDKPNAWIYGELYGPSEQPGTIFCTNPEGTGVNVPDRKPVPKAGDATLGECARQICVNDLKH